MHKSTVCESSFMRPLLLIFIPQAIFDAFGDGEFFPNDDLIKFLGKDVCPIDKELLDICEDVLFLICGFDRANINIVSLHVFNRSCQHSLTLSLSLSSIDSSPCLLHAHPGWYVCEELCPFFTGSEVWQICHVRLWQCTELGALWNSKPVIFLLCYGCVV